MYKSIFIINFYLRGEFAGFFNFLPVGFFGTQRSASALRTSLAFPLKLSVTNRFYYLSKLAFKHSGYSLLAETMTDNIAIAGYSLFKYIFKNKILKKGKGLKRTTFNIKECL